VNAEMKLLVSTLENVSHQVFKLLSSPAKGVSFAILTACLAPAEPRAKK